MQRGRRLCIMIVAKNLLQLEKPSENVSSVQLGQAQPPCTRNRRSHRYLGVLLPDADRIEEASAPTKLS